MNRDNGIWEQKGWGKTHDEIRSALLLGLDTTPIKRTIPFLNDDVPRYLEKLHQFEADSREVEIEVRTTLEEVK